MSALEQTVPEGYKQTEAGVIPVDWTTSTLSDLLIKIIDNRGKTPPISRDGEFELIETASISFVGLYPDYKKVTKRVSVHTYNNWFRGHPKKDDLLISTVGEYSGASAILGQNRGTIAQNLIALRLKSGNYPKFTFYWTRSSLYKAQLEQVMMNQAQPSLRVPWLLNFKLPIPSYKEQIAIANALSDVDALLTELEKLIAKKQVIKTATMQQLLTGKTRLPQFATYTEGEKQGQPKGTKPSELGEIPEDWDVVSFGELFEQSISRKSLKADMTATFVGMQDVSENARLIKQTPVNISKVKSGFTYFECDDVLVAKITPCFENGKGCHTKQLDTEHGFGSTEFHVLRAKLNADSDFIYFWTTREIFRQELESEMVGSAGHRRVPFSALQNYKIPCPDSKKEQTAIATILSDMDNEIQTLEQRLVKTRQIKQGMMQELLTGRTRLPY